MKLKAKAKPLVMKYAMCIMEWRDVSAQATWQDITEEISRRENIPDDRKPTYQAIRSAWHAYLTAAKCPKNGVTK